VGLDRALLDDQALRDVAVGLAQGDRLQDVAFPGTDAGQVPGPYNTFLSVASPALFPALGNLDRLTATIIGGGVFAVLIVVWTRGRLGYPAPAASAGLPPDDRG
jgi:hypothetical protein